MEKFKNYGSLVLAMLGCFNIGLYASSTFRYNEPIEMHRWIMTSIFGLAFLVYFLTEFKNK
jgi:hypothetical protein